ncbi:LOW QUALITY PROTEIN: uncharacterized protein PRD47_018770 [Ara ararauna]
MRPAPLLGLLLWAPLLLAPPVRSPRHSVHWNGSNPRFLRDDYTIQVAINDYLDIYCPHYEGSVPAGAETFTLFMVDREGYRGCYETPGAFKRWECNKPQAPFGPVRFSEKIQRFAPFPLGFEFQPGETYYYISVPSPESAGRCLKLRVSVCCRGTTPEPLTEVLNSQPPLARGARGHGARPQHRSPATAPRPVPSAAAPGPALDVTHGRDEGPLPHRPLPDSSSIASLLPPKPVGQPQATTHPPDLHRAEPGPGAPGWKDLASHWHCRTSALPDPCPGAMLYVARWTPALPQGHRLILCLLPPWTLHAGGLGTPQGPGAEQQLLWALDGGPSAALSSGEDTPICLLGRRLPPCRHRPLRFGFNPW